MRAARIVSPNKFEIFNEEIPSLSDGKVIVRLLRAAICGSDLPYFSMSHDLSSYPLPSGYPGHECLGIIEESMNREFKKGDLVMYYPVFLEGFKECHLTDQSRLQKIPCDRDLNILLMTQLLGAVSHCVFRIDPPYNKDVVIMGLGPVGLLFTSLVRNLGARNIIVVDPIDFRLDVAKSMGATHSINPNIHSVIDSVSEITNGKMSDIVIDAFGQDVDVMNLCFDLACHNGQVAFFGICLEGSPRLNFSTFFRKELRMISSVGPDLSIDYPFALNMILENSIDVSPLITHVIPFEEIQRGFDIATNRHDDVIKIVLKF